MKRVRFVTDKDECDEFYQIEEFAFNKCGIRPLSTFLRIQFDKGLITAEEFFEILGISEEDALEGRYCIINW